MAKKKKGQRADGPIVLGAVLLYTGVCRGKALAQAGAQLAQHMTRYS